MEDNNYNNSGNGNNPYRPSTPSSSSTPSSTPRPSSPSSSYTRPQDRPIDVTKPRPTYDRSNRPAVVDEIEKPLTNAEREQQALERLRNRANGLPASGGTVAKAKPQRDKGDTSKKIKTIIAIILVVIIIIILSIFIILLGRNEVTEEELYDIRVSMTIENKSVLSLVTETGQEVLKEIHPGDRIPIKAYARNSNDYRGDAYDSNNLAPPSIYVRFKLVLILDYEDRPEILVPNLSPMWYKYNHEDEAGLVNGMQFDDGYYYYKDTVVFLQRIELFDSILFDGNKVYCEDGGKYGQIQVIVESIEADINNVITQGVWPTAPRYWVSKMQGSGFNE